MIDSGPARLGLPEAMAAVAFATAYRVKGKKDRLLHYTFSTSQIEATIHSII